MIPKAFLTAATDPELRPAELRLYIFLHFHLDYVAFRPVKQTWLTRHLALTRENLSRGISRLCELGYLDRQKQRGRGSVQQYRIPLSVPE
jgi:DNA-binding MarR family transcriptional regulator